MIYLVVRKKMKKMKKIAVDPVEKLQEGTLKKTLSFSRSANESCF